MKNKLKSFCLALIYIIIFTMLYVFLGSIYQTFSKDYCDILSIITILIIYIIVKKDDVIKDFKNLKKSHFKLNILLFLIMFIVVTTCSKLFPKIFNTMITNEQLIEDNIAVLPIKSFILTCILAPIYEEILVRKNFKEAFSNKWIFIIVTGLIFASLHILNIQNILELVYFPLYIIMGLTLSYIYYNDDNILSSMIFHMLNNILAFIIVLIF